MNVYSIKQIRDYKLYLRNRQSIYEAAKSINDIRVKISLGQDIFFWFSFDNEHVTLQIIQFANNPVAIRTNWIAFLRNNKAILKDNSNFRMVPLLDQRIKRPLEDFYDHQLLQNLSIQTLNILSIEPFKSGEKLLYALFLHLSLIRARNSFFNEGLPFIVLKGYCWFNLKSIDLNTKQGLAKSYSGDKSHVEDIYKTIMSREPHDLNRLPDWVKGWFTICFDKFTMDRLRYFNKEFMLDIETYLLPDLINQHLGLTNQQKLTLIFYINKLVNDIRINFN